MIIIFFVFYILYYIIFKFNYFILLFFIFLFHFFPFFIFFFSFIFSFFSLSHTYPNLLLPIPPTSKGPMLPLSHWFPLFSFLFFFLSSATYFFFFQFVPHLLLLCFLPPRLLHFQLYHLTHTLHPTSSRLTTPTLTTPFFSLFLHFSPSFLLTNSPRPHPLKKHIATCPPLPFLSFTVLINLYLY